MTKEELVARLRDIEWDDFEVKAAKSELPKNVWETVSAFSTTGLLLARRAIFRICMMLAMLTSARV